MKRTKGYADGKFGQIHYLTCGEGPPLVLHHQGPTSMVQFDKVFDLLAAEGIQAIGIDLPGYGSSDRPDHVPTIAEYAHIMPAVLDHLGIEKADILGHHTGAIVATEVVLQYPERINRIILNGPFPLTDEERVAFRELMGKEKDWAPREDGSHLTDQWSFRMGAQPGWTDLDAIHRHVVQAAAAWPYTYYAHDAVLAYDHGEAIMKIQHPCLVLSNNGDSIHHIAERAKDMRPDFDYIEMEGGTFDILDEQPEAWSKAVTGWLNDGR